MNQNVTRTTAFACVDNPYANLPGSKSVSPSQKDDDNLKTWKKKVEASPPTDRTEGHPQPTVSINEKAEPLLKKPVDVVMPTGHVSVMSFLRAQDYHKQQSQLKEKESGMTSDDCSLNKQKGFLDIPPVQMQQQPLLQLSPAQAHSTPPQQDSQQNISQPQDVQRATLYLKAPPENPQSIQQPKTQQKSVQHSIHATHQPAQATQHHSSATAPAKRDYPVLRQLLPVQRQFQLNQPVAPQQQYRLRDTRNVGRPTASAQQKQQHQKLPPISLPPLHFNNPQQMEKRVQLPQQRPRILQRPNPKEQAIARPQHSQLQHQQQHQTTIHHSTLSNEQLPDGQGELDTQSVDPLHDRLDQIWMEIISDECTMRDPVSMLAHRFYSGPSPAELAERREGERSRQQISQRCNEWRREMNEKGASEEEIMKGVWRIYRGKPPREDDDDIQVVRDVIDLTSGAVAAKRPRLPTGYAVTNGGAPVLGLTEDDLNDALELIGMPRQPTIEAPLAKDVNRNVTPSTNKRESIFKRPFTPPDRTVEQRKKATKPRPRSKKQPTAKDPPAMSTAAKSTGKRRRSASTAPISNDPPSKSVAKSSAGRPRRTKKEDTDDVVMDLSGPSTSKGWTAGGKQMDGASTLIFPRTSKKDKNIPKPVPAPLAFPISERLVDKERKQRMNLYKHGIVFNEFPQMENNTNVILSDFAAAYGKSMAELIEENEKLWASLDKMREVINEEDKKECEGRVMENDDPDLLKILHLLAYLNGYKTNRSLDRISKLYTKLKFPTTAVAIAHLDKLNTKHLLILKCGPDYSKHYLYIDTRAIPVEGGLRHAVLSLVAATYLFDIEFNPQVADVAKFFYLSAGNSINKVPPAVKSAMKIVSG